MQHRGARVCSTRAVCGCARMSAAAKQCSRCKHIKPVTILHTLLIAALTHELRAALACLADVVYLDAKTDTYLEEVSSCNIFVVSGKTIRVSALAPVDADLTSPLHMQVPLYHR